MYIVINMDYGQYKKYMNEVALTLIPEMYSKNES